MGTINKILADYYWIFLILGIAILIFLIRFLILNRKKTKEQESLKQANANNAESGPTKDMPQQPAIQQATQMVSSVSGQTYSEPTLDFLKSSASEVNLGFNQNDNGMSMGADGPMLVIEDPNAKNEEFGLVIEDPNAKSEEVSLVIEDPNLVQNNVVVPEPSIFETVPAPVVASVTPAAPIENSIFEPSPAVPVVAVTPEVVSTPVVTTPVVEPVQPVAAVVNTPVVTQPQVAVPVQSVVQSTAVPQTSVAPAQPVVSTVVNQAPPVSQTAQVQATAPVSTTTNAVEIIEL